MIEEVNFNNTDMSVNVSIDNEKSKDLPIKEIIKLPTYIKINQPLDTAYLDDILVDLTLYYINDKGESKPLNIDGLITIYLSNLTADEWISSFREKCYEKIIPVNENIPWLDENNNPVETDVIKAVVRDCVVEGKTLNVTSFTVRFKKGHVKTTIPNNLPINSYVLSFQYLGNKYFESTYYESYFSINKRLVSCIFDKNIKNAYPKEDIVFNGVLKDAKTQKILTNTDVNFNFHGVKYTTSTNMDGQFSIRVTLPDADISHCDLYMNETDFSPIESWIEYLPESDNYYIDEDGNIRTKESSYESTVEFNDVEPTHTVDNYTYPGDTGDKNLSKTTYPIKVYINNPSYYLPSTYIHADVKKLSTEITMNTANCNETTNIIKINGSVITTDDNVHYGRVAVEFPELQYKQETLAKVSQNGGFSTDIDLKEIYNMYNNNTTSEMEEYSLADEKITAVTLSGDDKVKIGETFIIEGTVKTSDMKIIKDGMLVFTIYKKEDDTNIEVYKYATELDDTGVAILSFNTSKQIDYFIIAKYYGMFGYQNSTSGEHKVEVSGAKE